MLRCFSYGGGDIDRFWRKVQKSDGCWRWTGKPNKKGYGRFGVNWMVILAHRFAWEATNGPIPDGLSVLHRCDNPICVRPDHLFLGTIADNNADMRAKGRAAPMPQTPNNGRFGVRPTAGRAHPRAKLTPENITAIRSLRQQGTKYRDIADQFDISIAQAQKIAVGESWKEAAL